MQKVIKNLREQAKNKEKMLYYNNPPKWWFEEGNRKQEWIDKEKKEIKQLKEAANKLEEPPKEEKDFSEDIRNWQGRTLLDAMEKYIVYIYSDSCTSFGEFSEYDEKIIDIRAEILRRLG